MVLDGLLSAPPALVYVLVGLLVFGEAAVFVGFVLPGETAVVLGGVLASRGEVDLPALILLVAVCAIVGDSVGFEVGRHFGDRVLRWRPLRRHEARLDGARAFLRERGGVAVFLGRWTAFLRAVMPGLAGVSRMPYRRFLVWNAIGGIAGASPSAWSATWPATPTRSSRSGSASGERSPPRPWSWWPWSSGTCGGAGPRPGAGRRPAGSRRTRCRPRGAGGGGTSAHREADGVPRDEQVAGGPGHQA